jgi:hypothetical protein
MARRRNDPPVQLGLFDAPASQDERPAVQLTAVQAPRALSGLSTVQVGFVAESRDGTAERAVCQRCLDRLGAIPALAGGRFVRFLWEWDSRSRFPEVRLVCAECGRSFGAEGFHDAGIPRKARSWSA